MHEVMQRLESELAAALYGLEAREAQLTSATHPDKWNIQQIVEHLLLTYRSSAGVLRTRIGKGKATQAKPMLQQRIGQFYLITLGYFPRGRMAPAEVSPTLPASLRDGDELIRRLKEDLREFDRTTTEAETLFGGKRFASHMVLGPLNAGQWRRFHLVHGEHHIKQIRRIRNDHHV